jgi:hypothetical protein
MKESEVALTEAVKRVVSVNDFPTIVLHLILHAVNKKGVTDWLPRVSSFGSLDSFDVFERRFFSGTY